MNRPEDNNAFDASLEREIAEGEAWLGGYPDEGPSPLAVARVKQAVRAELARSRRSSRHWGAWIGVAAAAAIVLAVATSWPGGTEKGVMLVDSRSPEEAAPSEIVSPWSSDDTTDLNEMSDAVSELETWASNTAGDWDVTSVYTAVEVAQDEMLDDDGMGDDVSLRLRLSSPSGEIVRNYDA